MGNLIYEEFVNKAFKIADGYGKGQDPAKLANSSDISINKMISGTVYSMWIHNNDDFLSEQEKYHKGEIIINDVLHAKTTSEILEKISEYNKLLENK